MAKICVAEPPPTSTMPCMAKKKEKPESSPPSRAGKSFTMWLDERLDGALQAYVDSVKPKTTKKAVIELAVEEYLAKIGMWPPPSE